MLSCYKSSTLPKIKIKNIYKLFKKIKENLKVLFSKLDKRSFEISMRTCVHLECITPIRPVIFILDTRWDYINFSPTKNFTTIT